MRCGRRRGNGCAAFALFALILAVAGCGGPSGRGAETDSEKGSDVEFLNLALARELTTLAAYTEGLPSLNGRPAAAARRFRGQEQEYVDAITKAIRGLGGDTEAEAEEIDPTEAKTPADILLRLYELESASLAAYVEASPRLFTSAPRTLATALAAGHAQHLVILRQSLGAAVADSAPEAFDGGEVPPPEPEPAPPKAKPGSGKG